MSASKHGRRQDVLRAAIRAGWEYESATYDGGDLVRDIFTSHLGVVRVVWLRTPWSEGRFAGAIFSERLSHKERNMWSVSGNNSLIALLDSAKVEGG